MKRRGFGEKTQHIYNPMPKMTGEQVMKLVHERHPGLLEAVQPPAEDPFRVWIKYGGPPVESIMLGAGEHISVRENEVEEIVTRDIAEHGIVVLDTMDETEVRKKSIEGLKRARAFYKARGAKRLQEIRKNLGLGREEMEDQAYDHWRYYFNEARADLVEQKMMSLRRNAGRRKSNAESEDAA